MKLEFDTLWADMLGILRAYAFNSVSYHDAEDLISSFSVKVWTKLNGDKEFKEREHAKAYFIKGFKHDVLDFVRQRKRDSDKWDGFGYVTPTYSLPEVYSFMRWSDMETVAVRMGPLHWRIYMEMRMGSSHRDIETRLRIPKVTVAKMIRHILDRVRWLERVSYAKDAEGRVTVGLVNKQTGEESMDKIECKMVNGVVQITIGRDQVGTATVNDKLEVENITLRKKGLDQEAITDAVCDYVKNEVTVAMIPPKTKPSTQGYVMPQKGEGGGKKMSEETKKKLKAKAPKAPDLPARDALDLSKVKDFPANLAEWQKKCGGAGYCLGGSGQPVAKRFKPGYDAKLKSNLKRVGSANAQSIAKELGWFSMIKWEKPKVTAKPAKAPVVSEE